MMFLVWISRNFLRLFYPQCWISVSSCQLLALLTVVWHYHSQLVWIAFCKGCHGMLLCSGMVILCWPGTIPISFYPILIHCNTIWFLGKRVLFNTSDGRILLVRKEWISALKLCAELEKDIFFYNWVRQCCDGNFMEGWEEKYFGVTLIFCYVPNPGAPATFTGHFCFLPCTFQLVSPTL